MRFKKEKFFGMPVPDDEATREKLRNLSPEELEQLGIETRFWSWYRQIAIGMAKLTSIMFVIIVAAEVVQATLDGSSIDFMRLGLKFLAFASLPLIVPLIVVAVSYLWWHGSRAIERLRGEE